jgi:hypothetical protein
LNEVAIELSADVNECWRHRESGEDFDCACVELFSSKNRDTLARKSIFTIEPRNGWIANPERKGRVRSRNVSQSYEEFCLCAKSTSDGLRVSGNTEQDWLDKF